MKTYKLRKVHSDSYGYIIFSTSYINPLDEVSKIEKDLMSRKFTGKVLFDMLMSNGCCKNRFFKGYFDGKSLDLKSIELTCEIEDKAKEFSAKFYKDNFDKVNVRILPQATQYKIKHGLVT